MSLATPLVGRTGDGLLIQRVASDTTVVSEVLARQKMRFVGDVTTLGANFVLGFHGSGLSLAPLEESPLYGIAEDAV